MKAYELNLDKIEEGYRYDPIIAHGETRSKAKSEIWKKVEDYGFGPLYFSEELTFLNLPIRRAKEYDKIEFEGKLKTKREIEEIGVERKRIAKLNSFLDDNEITHCYVRKGSYYQPGSCGYTSFKSRAGVYTIKEGVSHARGCEDIWLEMIDVNEHNKMLEDEIKSLKSRLI